MVYRALQRENEILISNFPINNVYIVMLMNVSSFQFLEAAYEPNRENLNVVTRENTNANLWM